MRTRPYMSPIRPSVTTTTAVTSRYPIRTHSRYEKLAGSSGSSWMPRKIAGSAMIRLVALMAAISPPSVVFDRATHL